MDTFGVGVVEGRGERPWFAGFERGVSIPQWRQTTPVISNSSVSVIMIDPPPHGMNPRWLATSTTHMILPGHP